MTPYIIQFHDTLNKCKLLQQSLLSTISSNLNVHLSCPYCKIQLPEQASPVENLSEYLLVFCMPNHCLFTISLRFSPARVTVIPPSTIHSREGTLQQNI